MNDENTVDKIIKYIFGGLMGVLLGICFVAFVLFVLNYFHILHILPSYIPSSSQQEDTGTDSANALPTLSPVPICNTLIKESPFAENIQTKNSRITGDFRGVVKDITHTPSGDPIAIEFIQNTYTQWFQVPSLLSNASIHSLPQQLPNGVQVGKQVIVSFICNSNGNTNLTITSINPVMNK